ncbi:MAG: hypothetical protein ABI821_12335 [Pseudomonadota bacterium]
MLAAAPLASDEAADLVGAEADETVMLKTPAHLSSIGQWYEDFEQVGDAEVCGLLANAGELHRGRDAQMPYRNTPTL